MDNDQVVTGNEDALVTNETAGETAEAVTAATPPKRPVRTRRKPLPKTGAAADTAAATTVPAEGPVPAEHAVPAEGAAAPAAEATAKAPVRRSRARKVAEPAEPLPAFAADAAAPAAGTPAAETAAAETATAQTAEAPVEKPGGLRDVRRADPP